MRQFQLAFALVAAAVNLHYVCANVFPTKPVADTVYRAGDPATVTWTDDGRKPHLKDVGGLRIELYTSDEIFVATLAKGVSPRKRSHTVYLPLEIDSNATDFNLRFVSKDPPMTIFTADFSIFGGTSNGNATYETDGPSSTFTGAKPLFSLAAAGNGTTIYAPPLPAATTVRADPLNDDRTERNGENWTRGQLDLEKLKFRIVFILWPALIGVTMAM